MIKFLTINIDSVCLWTDSMVILYWITGDLVRWTMFVSNQVTQIQTILPSAHWRHIPSGDNSADLASRGVLGEQLIDSPLWLTGSCCIVTPSDWPIQPRLNISTILPEYR